MERFVLYCKSYSKDVLRVKRLAESVRAFNFDKLPFFISVPAHDIALFQQILEGFPVHLLTDESIIAANPRLDPCEISLLHGNISQQIIKSEFWRLGLAGSYLCLDSDAFFIRPFHASDYLQKDDIPYTVIDEARELLESSLAKNRKEILANFHKEAASVQSIFHREGPAYNFGPFPVTWHRSVWESLDLEYLQPGNMTIQDAIKTIPIESRWYGEALLRYGAIPLLPRQPLFKVYHYAWQFDQHRRAGIGLEELAALYSGVIYQSAWERDLDWPQESGSWMSRSARHLRRRLGRM